MNLKNKKIDKQFKEYVADIKEYGQEIADQKLNIKIEAMPMEDRLSLCQILIEESNNILEKQEKQLDDKLNELEEILRKIGENEEPSKEKTRVRRVSYIKATIFSQDNDFGDIQIELKYNEEYDLILMLSAINKKGIEKLRISRDDYFDLIKEGCDLLDE